MVQTADELVFLLDLLVHNTENGMYRFHYYGELVESDIPEMQLAIKAESKDEAKTRLVSGIKGNKVTILGAYTPAEFKQKMNNDLILDAMRTSPAMVLEHVNIAPSNN